MKFLTKLILIVLFLGATLFAKDVATVTGLNGKAFIQRDGTKIDIAIGSALQEKDTIITNNEAKVQLIFTDETIITVGKNSNFSIKEYLFEDNQEPVAKFAMLKGAMRTITGKIGKIAPDKFSVQAKTATIGIRGTNFSILVDGDSVNVYCTFGAINVTVSNTDYVVQQGFFVTISPDGKVELKEFNPENLKEMKKTGFGKSESKKGDASEDSTANNEGQLDNTTEEFDNIVIKDISDTTVDAEQTTTNSNLADLISGYTMSNASYTGTISNVTSISGGLGLENGDSAKLDVDFGADSATLTIKEMYEFGTNSSINGTHFSMDANAPNSGSASGDFSGATGQDASGTFTITEPNSYGNSGNFNVSTSQTLH